MTDHFTSLLFGPSQPKARADICCWRWFQGGLASGSKSGSASLLGGVGGSLLATLIVRLSIRASGRIKTSTTGLAYLVSTYDEQSRDWFGFCSMHAGCQCRSYKCGLGVVTAYHTDLNHWPGGAPIGLKARSGRNANEDRTK